MQTISFSWPTSQAPGHIHEYYRTSIERRIRMTFPEDPKWMNNIILIIDEAQRSYRHASFWNDLVKPLAQDKSSGPYIVLLSSFGSPSQQFNEYTGDTSAPPYLSQAQRVSMRPFGGCNAFISLYLLRHEFDDILHRVCTAETSPGFQLDASLQDNIFRLSSGHAGCARALLEMIRSSNASLVPTARIYAIKANTYVILKHARPYRLNNESVPVSVLDAIMSNPNFYYSLRDTNGFGRAFPVERLMRQRPELSVILQRAAVLGCVRGNIADIPGLNEVYKNGWLHAELSADGDTIYIAPTPIHSM